MVELTTGARRLRAALAAVNAKGTASELAIVSVWLDSWVGLGLIVDGMARQGYDANFRQYPMGWRVNFLHGERVEGTGWAREPWRAVQQAAWDALRKIA